ncbi:MAG: redox-sensing transcriptional repressor Rex [Candidatus Omnitrophota bacterium]
MKNISSKTVSRVLLYVRTLESLIRENKCMVSSGELARITGLTDVQIRKDISNFGKVGTPRVGYNALELKNILEEFILQKKVIRIILFGAGNLGKAILKYAGFGKQKLEIVAAFDKDKKKIGKTVNGVKVHSFEKAPFVIKKNIADIGVIAVPKETGQEVADLIVSSGIKSIVNFAPISLKVPKEIHVRNIDLAIEFLSAYCDARV